MKDTRSITRSIIGIWNITWIKLKSSIIRLIMKNWRNISQWSMLLKVCQNISVLMVLVSTKRNVQRSKCFQYCCTYKFNRFFEIFKIFKWVHFFNVLKYHCIDDMPESERVVVAFIGDVLLLIALLILILKNDVDLVVFWKKHLKLKDVKYYFCLRSLDVDCKNIWIATRFYNNDRVIVKSVVNWKRRLNVLSK